MSPTSVRAAGRSRRPSLLAMLVAGMLVALPVLAVLQYRWLGQLSAAEHERLQRTLRASASDLGRSLELELVRILIGLQVDTEMLAAQDWDGYADRVTAWRAAAIDPDLVSTIWLADARGRDRAPLQLRQWDAAARAFTVTTWPDALADLHERLWAPPPTLDEPRPPLFHRPLDVPGLEAVVLVLPVLSPPTRPEPSRHTASLDAFTIVALDLSAIRREVLPTLVARHFGSAEAAFYHVAIVARGEPARVLYEASPGDAYVLADRADIVEPLFGIRRDHVGVVRRAAASLQGIGDPGGESIRRMFFARRWHGSAGADVGSPGHTAPGLQETAAGAGHTAPRLPAEALGRAGDDWARWHLLIRHRAGSLEAAVAHARQRNLALSFGLLFLMAASIALIVVAARRAERLGAQQMEFVAAVSHELRTPVSVLASAGDNLAQGVVTDPARVREYGHAIRAEARRLGESVERVLGFAGIQAGRIIGDRVAVRPGAVIDRAVAATMQVAADRGTSIEVWAPTSLPDVVADPEALRSAIENLIVNAAKYGAGPIRVRAAAETSDGRSELRISVSDEGPGIPAGERSKVFEPFYRGRDALARRIQGSGLGLSIVRSIVEAHGGRVSLTPAVAPVPSRPTPGAQGSTFTLHLPLPAEGDRQVAREPVAREGHA